jgi:hypothetical protein
MPAEAQKPDYVARIQEIQKNVNDNFRSSYPDLFLESSDTSRNKNPYSYLWPVCALFQAENEAEALTPGTDRLSPFLKTLAQYYNPAPPAPGYQACVALKGKDTRYYDDNQWLGITAMDAYARTGRKNWLELAKTIYNFMITGCDTVSGGGIYWREGDMFTKNTCSNGPGIILALRLYQSTRKKEYLETAKDLYAWVNNYLRSPDGIYYDALKVKTMRIDSATYTYNTGTMLQSDVLLWRITGEKKYLDEAQLVAAAAEKYFFHNGKLPNDYWFNAVMLRGFIELAAADGDYGRLRFFAADAERIWPTLKSRKKLIDQAAMLEIYARLEMISYKMNKDQ